MCVACLEKALIIGNFAGSMDRTLCLWDLRSGLPLSQSKPLGAIVRGVAMDDSLLVAGLSDNSCRVVRANRSDRGPLFDLSTAEDDSAFLRGHSGPVSCVDLTPGSVTTGSWDCTVRTYNRGRDDELALVRTDGYDDWVQSLVVRGKHTLVASGSIVYCVDHETGQTVMKFEGLHESTINALEVRDESNLVILEGSPQPPPNLLTLLTLPTLRTGHEGLEGSVHRGCRGSSHEPRPEDEEILFGPMAPQVRV